MRPMWPIGVFRRESGSTVSTLVASFRTAEDARAFIDARILPQKFRIGPGRIKPLPRG